MAVWKNKNKNNLNIDLSNEPASEKVEGNYRVGQGDSLDSSDNLNNINIVDGEIVENKMQKTDEPIVAPLKKKKRVGAYNGFDRFFIGIYSLCASFVVNVGSGINWVLKKIFRHQAPARYVNAFVCLAILVLLLTIIFAPISAKNKGQEIEIFKNNLVAVEKKIGVDKETNSPITKWGYVDRFGKTKIQFVYDNALPFLNGGAFVKCLEVADGVEKNYWVVIDRRGREKSERFLIENDQVKMVSIFSKNAKLAYAYKNGLYGFVNTKGKTIIPFVYREVGEFNKNGLAPVKFGENQSYFINKKGVKIGADYKNVMSFTDGLGAVLNNNNKWGFINSKGKLVIECAYDVVSPFVDGFATVKVGETYGVIDKKGKYVLNPEYSNINIPIYVY